MAGHSVEFATALISERRFPLNYKPREQVTGNSYRERIIKLLLDAGPKLHGR
jgi:hypothetical protein